MTNALSVRGLTVRRGRQLLLEDISFSAPPGAVTALLGLQGAGKTTLLAAIAGLVPLLRGAVLRGQTDITALPAHRRDIALLPPGRALPETARLGALLRRRAGRAAPQRADTLLDGFALGTLAGRTLTGLTHGEALLALAAARLARQAGVMLIDEGGTGLGAAAIAALTTLLQADAARGATILLATRDPRLALRADYLVLLAEGRVRQAGTPASLYGEPRDAACALLTGPANILTGQIRELRSHGFFWSAGGRFLQSADPDLPRPSLGESVTLCLRPERLSLLQDGEPADNVTEATITDLRAAGPLLDLTLDTPLGRLLLSTPSWPRTHYPARGQKRRIGWAAGAAQLLEG